MSLKQIFEKATVIDVLLVIVGFSLLGVASPYVVRQFDGLKRFGDFFWNFSWDVMVFAVGLVVLILLGKLLRVFCVWCEKHSDSL